jgi:hypothetical protein
MRVTLSSLATAALLVAARPAAAQQVVAGSSRPLIVPAASAAAPTPRVLANYRLAGPGGTGMPERVTVADSAGRLVASYRPGAGRADRPMEVAVLDEDLVLQAETPSGFLTLRLYAQNSAEPTGPVAGRWWLGEQEGALRGRVSR